MKAFLAKIFHPVERLFDGMRRKKRPDSVVIDPYLGFATPEHIVLRGRVLKKLKRTNPVLDASWITNLRQMVSLFLTDEVAGVTITAGEVTGITDEEGYFTLHLPRDAAWEGWQTVHVCAENGDDTDLAVFLPPKDAPYAVVSDIDDTVMETGAYSIFRNLWTSLTGSALSRHIFPDAVELMQRFADEKAPIYFVSSSPWNLHHFLQRIFTRAGLPRAPLFLRDLGLSDKQFISGTHGNHKGSAIDTLIAAHPELEFILIGDTGQHDPQVYLDAAKRHPGRIRQVIFREPGKGADKRDLADIEAIQSLGIPVAHGPDFRPVLDAD